MKKLNKEININKKFIILLILVNILVIGLYYSYALFEISVIQDNIVVLKTGTIEPITTTITGYEDATFTLAVGETKTLTINLETTNTTDIGYKMYYEILSGNSTFSVIKTADYENGIVEGIMNTSKTISLNFTNTGEESITIKLGTEAGLKEYEVVITQGTALKLLLLDDFKEELLTRTNSYTLEDNIYYVSGAKDDNDEETTDDIDFNYVWYSGKLWRITQINPDGTMKMITDSAITVINWGASSTVSIEDLTSAYSTSYIREWLIQEFLPTLYNYENIIVEDAGWYSITNSASPPTKPTGDYTLTDPVGLLNAYEYYKSYEKLGDYTNGYLNNGYYWWLITPHRSWYYVHYVSTTGALYSDYPSPWCYGVRPTINLTSTIQLSGGSGTIDDPYKIKGDNEEIESNTTLLNSRQSGEYVKFSSDETSPIFRIIDTELVGENLTTKIVLNDYIKESDTVLTKYFSSADSYELWSEVDSSDTTYWRGYLNTTWLGTIDTSMLEKGTYYLGYHTTGSYKTTVCSTVSSDVSIKECIENGTIVSNISSNDYVGLLRVGEMFASQTSDYTSSTASHMWLITPYNSSIVRFVNKSDFLNEYYGDPSSYSYGVRPSINLKSTIIIKSGSGTKQDPFVVSLPTT